ncbi:MAG: hypothetical protein V3T88_03660 [Nitrosomonadaceae bacterium]
MTEITLGSEIWIDLWSAHETGCVYLRTVGDSLRGWFDSSPFLNVICKSVD